MDIESVFSFQFLVFSFKPSAAGLQLHLRPKVRRRDQTRIRR
jgi:hypothetical protein